MSRYGVARRRAGRWRPAAQASVGAGGQPGSAVPGRRAVPGRAEPGHAEAGGAYSETRTGTGARPVVGWRRTWQSGGRQGGQGGASSRPCGRRESASPSGPARRTSVVVAGRTRPGTRPAPVPHRRGETQDRPRRSEKDSANEQCSQSAHCWQARWTGRSNRSRMMELRSRQGRQDHNGRSWSPGAHRHPAVAGPCPRRSPTFPSRCRRPSHTHSSHRRYSSQPPLPQPTRSQPVGG